MKNFHVSGRPSERSELAGWYRAVLEAQEGSGLSVSEYAEEIGVTPATLYQWRRRLAAERQVKPRADVPGQGLVRVQVRDEEQIASMGRAVLVLRLAGGRSIEVPADFDARALARVVEVLEGC